ncbi:MAG: YkgJ family cysteine cluster protein [Desulfobacterales bacterium]|nr:YkgJ family cysteine cluster protein [Desulfobacterales bacterium]
MAHNINRQGSDINSPATWTRYNASLCSSCKALCCYLVVEVTAKDLLRLGLTDEHELIQDTKHLVKRLKKDGIITRVNLSKGKFTLGTRKKGGCIFLDAKNRCSVYEDRPDVCRMHPIKLSSRVGYCPWSPVN